MLKPYCIVIVARQRTRDGAALAQADEQLCRKSTVIITRDASEIKPLDLDTIPADVQRMANGLKTAMQRQAPMIQMHILVFPAKDAKGNPLVNERQRDTLKVVLKAVDPYPRAEVLYHTPFDAATPRLPCPTCKGQVSAKWLFCAWCGKKL